MYWKNKIFELYSLLCCCLVSKLCLTLLWPHGLLPVRLLCPWDFPGKNTGVGCHFLLQEIFLTQGSIPCLLHCEVDSLPLSHQGSLSSLVAIVELLCHIQLCNSMNCSLPGFSVLHYHQEFAQTHIHWVSDAIQPSHPLSPSSPAVNFPQHQVLFQWVGSWHQVARVIGASASASVLPMNVQGWFPLGLTGLILHCKGLSSLL